MKIVLNVNEILHKKGWTQKKLSIETGLRPATINEICNNQRKTMNKEHLEKIAEVLKITDIRDLISLRE